MPKYEITPGIPDLPVALSDKDYNLTAPVYRAIHAVAKQAAANTNFVEYTQAELQYVNQLTPLLLDRTNRIFAKAGETLAYGQMVYLSTVGGKYTAYRSDWDEDTGNGAVGCVNASGGIAAGALGEVIFMEGLCAGVSGTVLGTQYYLSAAGTITDTPVVGQLVQPVGIGLGAAGLFLDISPVQNLSILTGLGDATFVHTQAIPSTTWDITHTLRKFPSVTVIDSANEEVEGEVTYVSNSRLIVTFSAAFSGVAHLN